MVSAIATDKLRSNLKIDHYLSGDASTAKDIGWVDMRDYGRIMITALAAALTGTGITAFKILANSKSDGSGTDVEVKAHAVGSAPDAAGDYLVLECSAEEIRSLGADLRYVSANIDANNAGDNIAVTYIRAEPRFAQAGLTADHVA
jgi:hypothetical protein